MFLRDVAIRVGEYQLFRREAAPGDRVLWRICARRVWFSEEGGPRLTFACGLPGVSRRNIHDNCAGLFVHSLQKPCTKRTKGRIGDGSG